jgi:hypothetical protein
MDDSGPNAYASLISVHCAAALRRSQGQPAIIKFTTSANSVKDLLFPWRQPAVDAVFIDAANRRPRFYSDRRARTGATVWGRNVKAGPDLHPSCYVDHWPLYLSRQQAKRAKASKPTTSSPSPPRRGFKIRDFRLVATVTRRRKRIIPIRMQERHTPMQSLLAFYHLPRRRLHSWRWSPDL